jgi:hypothetical protein
MWKQKSLDQTVNKTYLIDATTGNKIEVKSDVLSTEKAGDFFWENKANIFSGEFWNMFK